MSNKNANRVNGSIATYFGVVMLIVALCSLVALGLSLRMGATGTVDDHAWEFILLFSAISVVGSLISYSLVRIGTEEIKK